MRVELPYRCWQVPSSFSSGRCKSFQRARRGKANIGYKWRCTRCYFSSLASLTARPTYRSLLPIVTRAALRVALFLSLLPADLLLLLYIRERSTCEPRRGVFRIRDKRSFTAVLLFTEGRAYGRIHGDEWKTILMTISFPLIAGTCRRFAYPPSRIGDASCSAHCRGSILISASETELSIYFSIISPLLVGPGKRGPAHYLYPSPL